jgi:DNA-binding CsgD family transcriptional regulator
MAMKLRDLDREADLLLEKAGAFRVDGEGLSRAGIYPEARLIGHYRCHVSQMPLEEVEEPLPESPRRSVAKALTPKQRQAAKLMAKQKSQAAVARVMGVSRSAVCHLLKDAELRIIDVLVQMDEEREDSITDIGLWMWRDEQRLKRRLIYRNNTHPLQSRR